MATCNTFGHRLAQGGMEMWIGRDDIASLARIPPSGVGNKTAGLAHEQDARREVPALQSKLPETIKATGCNPGEIERRRSEAPDARDLRHQNTERSGEG